ncbi:M90 family metallopeptidase [uncultured Hydrogenophaga sp.]|jgi:Mlc titration factor MtfA (ptsG expression regulator)|uniref:M90 family metallopeptidase n=1 Tax=uncultured Hydrogenophaga sp. TaxID=199683 RepID=UPI0025903080|nr:M90 family metallopeptidase [uncultured Hydrogenophaga sp.]
MSWFASLRRRWRRPAPVPDGLWRDTLAALPFLAALDGAELTRLRVLCQHFLAEKEFSGANGLVVTDAMALSIAAQACRPLLHLHGPDGRPVRHPPDLLDWYDDFVGIVLQPGAVLARREVRDHAGVVHEYTEALAGEAMDGGPLMLSWEDVASAGERAAIGHNVVIHEFVHKMDMRELQVGEHPQGAPTLPDGFLNTRDTRAARAHWQRVMKDAYEGFREAVALAERFGGEPPWLDDYAAKDPAEFFAVTCEAYFVSRERFGREFPALLTLYDGFFNASAAS